MRTFSSVKVRYLVLVFLFIPVSGWAKKHQVADDENSAQVSAPIKEGENGMELRRKRRVAVGVQAAGALGFGGALLELNLNPEWSTTIGYGGGEGFQTLELQAKYVLAGEWFMPYATIGIARWISLGKSGPIKKTSPSILADKLLTDDEKQDGEFHKNLIYPGIGLQFMQLKGPWAGSSIFAEFTVLMDFGYFVAAPTGTLGFLYYF